MIYYSQKDSRWANKKLGTSSVTIGSAGCFVTSLAMLDGRTPDVINDLLKNGGGFSGGNMLNSSTAPNILGLEYSGKTTTKPGYTCIAETDHYKLKGYDQHFFVLFTDGGINCPLLGENIVNPYKIVSYRLFREKETQMTWTNRDVISAIWKATTNEDVLPDVEFNYWDWRLKSLVDLMFLAQDWHNTKVKFLKDSIAILEKQASNPCEAYKAQNKILEDRITWTINQWEKDKELLVSQTNSLGDYVENEVKLNGQILVLNQKIESMALSRGEQLLVDIFRKIKESKLVNKFRKGE